MSIPTGPDPIEQLSAADPIRVDQVPDASLARVSARIEEHIMSDVKRDLTTRPTRGGLAWIAGFALVGVAALAIAFGPGLGSSAPGPIAANPSPTANPTASNDAEPTQAPAATDDPVATDDPAASDAPPAGGAGMASCIRYDPAILPTFEVVFDGTVTGIDRHQVTFKVNHGWKGAEKSITLSAPDVQIGLTGPVPDFAVDGRYLVTAAGATINSCGYTIDYDAASAAAWAAAFGG